MTSCRNTKCDVVPLSNESSRAEQCIYQAIARHEFKDSGHMHQVLYLFYFASTSNANPCNLRFRKKNTLQNIFAFPLRIHSPQTHALSIYFCTCLVSLHLAPPTSAFRLSPELYAVKPTFQCHFQPSRLVWQTCFDRGFVRAASLHCKGCIVTGHLKDLKLLRIGKDVEEESK